MAVSAWASLILIAHLWFNCWFGMCVKYNYFATRKSVSNSVCSIILFETWQHMLGFELTIQIMIESKAPFLLYYIFNTSILFYENLIECQQLLIPTKMILSITSCIYIHSFFQFIKLFQYMPINNFMLTIKFKAISKSAKNRLFFPKF